ncbi:MAG: hypothetical protein J1D77_03635 [Muribaculaceae bacterium]|nr:hypothetical protein [Muribaculaceae bacterium]
MAETKQKKFGLNSIKAFYTLIITAVKALIATAVAEVKAAFGSALEYKGSVADYDSLPKEGQKKGDTYNVVAAHGTTPAGTNYAWDGEKWDPLGGDVDLSNLALKSEIPTDYLTEDDLEDYVTDESLEEKLEDYVKDEALEGFLKAEDFEEYNETEIQEALKGLEGQASA